MTPPNTPQKPHRPNQEWHTPKRAQIKFLREQKHLTFRQIEQDTGVPHNTAFRLYRNGERRKHSGPYGKSNRGKNSRIVKPYHLESMVQLLKMEGFEARALTWAQLGMEVGLDCSDRTIQRAMETLNYRKCVACKKFWVNERLKEKRRDWADYMLEVSRSGRLETGTIQ